MEEPRNMIDHPNHYQKEGRKECIVEMRERYGAVATYWFCVLSAYKYRYREGIKPGNSSQQDLAKAAWYDNYAKSLYKEVNNKDIAEAIDPWEISDGGI